MLSKKYFISVVGGVIALIVIILGEALAQQLLNFL
jgi:hypothetical protein